MSVISMVVMLVVASASAQSPFVTDDINVAEYHRFHFEFSNEYDVLRSDSYPAVRQENANFKGSFGFAHNLEVGLDNQLLGIFNAGSAPAAFGYGDLDLSLKWKIREDGEASRIPGFAMSFNVEVPTGDEKKQLGSGIPDYYLNTIAQKQFKKNWTVRANGGLYFAGNTQTGAVGLKTTKGVVYTGAASVVHDFSERFDLGVELVGAMSHNFDLGKGQLQTEIGGNYMLRKSLSLDFGLIVGYYQSSPVVAPVIGFQKDF